MASSFPTVVGVAGWPCVWPSIGTAADACACATSAPTSFCSCGTRNSSRAPCSISACDTLLMSSDVHAKWMNSTQPRSCAAVAAAVPAASMCFPTSSLRKYSTAFTSWLVVRSIALIRSAPASASKLSASPCRNARAPARTPAAAASDPRVRELQQPLHLDDHAPLDPRTR